MAGYTITCEQCNLPFNTSDKRRKFCNRACFGESQLRSLQIKFWTKVKKGDSCWLWTGAIRQDTGYGTLQFPKGKNHQAHRMSWQIHNGHIPDGLQVCHTCDIRNCVRPDHLFLGTATDNMQDCAKKGRQSRKLNPDSVRSIRQRYSEGESAKVLASEFQVDKSMIHLIIKRIWWAHVT